MGVMTGYYDTDKNSLMDGPPAIPDGNPYFSPETLAYQAANLNNANSWASAPAGFNWGATALPTGGAGGAAGPAGSGTPAQIQGDPSKGYQVQMPDGSWKDFPPGPAPKVFIGESSQFPGGWAAAQPGTPEYEHYSNVMRTSTNQAAIKIAALVGGAAALGGTAWGSAPVEGAAPAAGGVVEGADALTPVTLPSSATYLPGLSADSSVGAALGMAGDSGAAGIGTGGGGLFSRLFGNDGTLSGLGNIANLAPQPSAPPATANFATRSGGGMNIPTSVQILLRSGANAGGLQRQMEAQRVASLL